MNCRWWWGKKNTFFNEYEFGFIHIMRQICWMTRTHIDGVHRRIPVNYSNIIYHRIIIVSNSVRNGQNDSIVRRLSPFRRNRLGYSHTNTRPTTAENWHYIWFDSHTANRGGVRPVRFDQNNWTIKFYRKASNQMNSNRLLYFELSTVLIHPFCCALPLYIYTTSSSVPNGQIVCCWFIRVISNVIFRWTVWV